MEIKSLKRRGWNNWELQDSPFVLSLVSDYDGRPRLIWRQRFYRCKEQVPVQYDVVSFEDVLKKCPEAARNDLLFHLDLFR